MKGNHIFTQVFRTLAGAQKRVAFENAHKRETDPPEGYAFFTLRFYKDVKDLDPYQEECAADYTWRIARVKKDHHIVL